MKKPVKIALIMLGVFALLLGVMALEGVFSDHKSSDKKQTNVFSVLTSTIQQEWRKEGQWNRELFDRQISQISQYRKRGKLTEDKRYQLLEWVGLSCNYVIDSIFNVQMAEPDSDERFVVENHKGLDFLYKYTDPRTGKKPFAEDVQIKKSIDMYAGYWGAFMFARQKFVASADVTDDFTWTSFADSRSKWDKQKSRIESGTYYASHFSKTNVVKRGWSQYASRVDEAKKVFYDALESNLKSKIENRLEELIKTGEELAQKKASITDDDGEDSSSALAAKEKEWSESVEKFVKLTSQAQDKLEAQAGSNSNIYSHLKPLFNSISPKLSQIHI